MKQKLLIKQSTYFSFKWFGLILSSYFSIFAMMNLSKLALPENNIVVELLSMVIIQIITTILIVLLNILFIKIAVTIYELLFEDELWLSNDYRTAILLSYYLLLPFQAMTAIVNLELLESINFSLEAFTRLSSFLGYFFQTTFMILYLFRINTQSNEKKVLNVVLFVAFLFVYNGIAIIYNELNISGVI